jgi:hypothetical protein
MISSIFGGLFQDWLIAKPRQFSIWLFGTETIAAALVAALFLLRAPDGGAWPGLGLLWYASYCVMLYFHWDRRRALKAEKPWKPSGPAMTAAVVCLVGFTALGGGLAMSAYGESMRTTVIGLVILGMGLLELVYTWRHGWPRLGL